MNGTTCTDLAPPRKKTGQHRRQAQRPEGSVHLLETREMPIAVHLPITSLEEIPAAPVQVPARQWIPPHLKHAREHGESSLFACVSCTEPRARKPSSQQHHRQARTSPRHDPPVSWSPPHGQILSRLQAALPATECPGSAAASSCRLSPYSIFIVALLLFVLLFLSCGSTTCTQNTTCPPSDHRCTAPPP